VAEGEGEVMDMFYITYWSGMSGGLLTVEGVAPTREAAEGLRVRLMEQSPYPKEMEISDNLEWGYRIYFTEAAEKQLNDIRTQSVIL
jgi:hypothetical protein